MNLASIPSPPQSVWHLGPFPLRAYALCIIAGVIAAVLISEKRLRARGGPPGAVVDIAVYAVPLGIVGARIYHVITTYQPYFGEGGHPLDMLMIWKGGLGIWGAIAGGAVGAWLGCRKVGIPLRVFADAVAPGLAVAQAIGRFGNWFNQELFGTPTNLPWGLRIDLKFRPTDSLDQATYHPTFLYESLWCLGVAAVVILLDRRLRLGHGRAFALYGLLYVLGRGWIELMRVDTANHILGLRLNVWTSILVGIAAIWYLVTHRGGRETLVLGEDGKVVRVIEEGAEPTPADASDAAADVAESAEPASDESADKSAAEPAVQPEPAAGSAVGNEDIAGEDGSDDAAEAPGAVDDPANADAPAKADAAAKPDVPATADADGKANTDAPAPKSL